MSGNSIPAGAPPAYDYAVSPVADDELDVERDQRTRLLDRQESSNYRHPTAESVRSSSDGSLQFSTDSSRASLEAEMGQMDYEEPLNRSELFRLSLSKRFRIFSSSILSIKTINSNVFQYIKSRLSHIAFIEEHLPKIRRIQHLGKALFALTAIIVVYALYIFQVIPWTGTTNLLGQSYDPESVRQYLLKRVDKDGIRHYLEYLTSFDHMAGTVGDHTLAEYVRDEFKSFGLDRVAVEEYHAYVNYPKQGGRRVAIISPLELAWSAKLEENRAYPPDSVDSPHPHLQTQPFHGLSSEGNVTGPLVYANYGLKADFDWLKAQGLDLKGSVVLVKRGTAEAGIGYKVKNAELAGAVGCIVYSDPKDSGFLKGKIWPDGPWLPDDGVQRDSVALPGWLIGDVLTPGYPSSSEAPRLSKTDSPGLNRIPSLPLSWKESKRLLQALKNHGKKVPAGWEGGVPGIEWWTGDRASPIVHLQNFQEEIEKQPLWNVVGRIQGWEASDTPVVVGNRRDAWCFGGVNPNSGTAVLLEVARLFGELVAVGWRPLRTIIFVNWDAEEYNMIGSTEWIEEHIGELRQGGVAYLNVDPAVSGKTLTVNASPLLESTLIRNLERIIDPETNKPLSEIFGQHRRPDPVNNRGIAFQSYAGISTLDMSFKGDSYPTHSCYDNFLWMQKFGDPNFAYHGLIAQLWGLLILDLADNPLVPFNLTAYAAAVKDYAHDLSEHAKKLKGSLDIKSLLAASQTLDQNGQEFALWAREWAEIIEANGQMETALLAVRRQSHNKRAINFEKHLLDLAEGGGLPGRNWFKHQVFGPQAWNPDGPHTFPGIRDAMEEGKWKSAQEQLEKASSILSKAANKLNN